VVHCSNIYTDGKDNVTTLRKGLNKIEVIIENLLQPGSYTLTPGIHRKDGLSLDYIENILDFEVLRIGESKEEDLVYGWGMGIIRLNSDWKVYG